MGYVEILLALAVATLTFIGFLIWFRAVRPGDYTVLKVIAGVALTIVAQYAVIAALGLPRTWADTHRLLVVPFAVSGGLIALWQAAEWAARQGQRVRRAMQIVERRLRKG